MSCLLAHIKGRGSLCNRSPFSMAYCHSSVPVIMIKCPNNYRLGIEQFTNTISNQIINCLHIHFPNQAILHTVYYGELAVCCSVSFSRRLVSSNNRAFSRATLMLLARVSSNRISDSLKAFSVSTFCRLTYLLTFVANNKWYK